jgi:FdhD protein
VKKPRHPQPKEIDVKRIIHRYTAAAYNPEKKQDRIVRETPLTMMVNGEEFATLVCSPIDLEELVIGFLASEGLIRSMEEIRELTLDRDKGYAYVELSHPPSRTAAAHSKRIVGSCCGKSRQFYFQSDARTAKTVMSRLQVTPAQCIRLMRKLQQASEAFHQTGGVHNAALCTPDQLLISYTDIGRHNTLDRIYGHCLQHRISLSDKLITFSGRVSSEVLLKTAKIGIGILLSKSAPTDLALDLAEDLGITVCGFIRGEKMNVYTHGERIVFSQR